MAQKICSKMHSVSCTNTHYEITDLVNHGMVKNTKTWISQEQNLTFWWNKKICNQCFRWHILRSDGFVAEITFNQAIGPEPNLQFSQSPIFSLFYPESNTKNSLNLCEMCNMMSTIDFEIFKMYSCQIWTVD